MKKLILPIIIILTVAFLLPQKANVQTNTDCHGIFTKESNACLKESTKCISSCVDKANAAMSLTVDGGKVMKECTRSVCDPASKACDDKAMANFRACGKSGKKPAASEVKEERVTQPQVEKRDIKDFLFNINRSFQSSKDLITVTYLSETDFQQAETTDINRKSAITSQDEEAAWAFVQSQPKEGKNGEWTLLPVKGEIEQKISDSSGKQLERAFFFNNNTKEWTFFDPKITNPDSEPALIRIQNIGDNAFKGLVTVPQGAEVQFLPLVKNDQTADVTRTVKFNAGEIEIKIQNTNPKNKFEVQTGSVSVVAPRTHFWVSQDPGKKQTVVGIYEGEVEVKTRDGKTVKVRPDGDKPGIAVVTQRFSIIKIIIASVILVAIVGAIAWFVKRNISPKVSKKR